MCLCALLCVRIVVCRCGRVVAQVAVLVGLCVRMLCAVWYMLGAHEALGALKIERTELTIRQGTPIMHTDTHIHSPL